jgi:hypothetical protein
MPIKIIWTYWHQGLEDAPPVVKPCLEQWKHLNPEWEIRFIDQHNMYDYIEPLDIKKETLEKMSLAISSDLFKLQFLIKYGGVWVDATTFPLVPLDDWLLNKMDAGYFYFYKPGRDRIISSWFIVAEKNNEMLVKHYEALKNYWNDNNFRNIGNPRASYMKLIYKLTNRNLLSTRLWFCYLYTKIFRVTPYLVTHYMFYNLISKHKDLKQRFELMPKISPKTSHAFKKEILYLPLSPKFKLIIDKKSTPMVKLNSRYVRRHIPKDCNLDYLFNQIIRDSN